MLTPQWLRTDVRMPLPWGSSYGLARTLIAVGTLLTLVFSDTESLFRPVRSMGEAPFCGGISGTGVFCVVPEGQLGSAQWACVAVLLVVASGWRPRWTGVPHWYVCFSVMNNIAIPDGGDQIAAILTLLLVPITLGDPRRWHWTPLSSGATAPQGLVVGVAVCAAVAAKIQVAGVYLHSSLAKLAVPEWSDGTVLYYWIHNPSFGAPPWAQDIAYAAVDTPAFVLLMTWVPLALEFALAISIVMSARARSWLLPMGIVFHVFIGATMGLWSFAFVMFGALVIMLTPIGNDSRLALEVTLLARRLGQRDGSRRAPDVSADPALASEAQS